VTQEVIFYNLKYQPAPARLWRAARCGAVGHRPNTRPGPAPPARHAAPRVAHGLSSLEALPTSNQTKGTRKTQGRRGRTREGTDGTGDDELERPVARARTDDQRADGTDVSPLPRAPARRRPAVCVSRVRIRDPTQPLEPASALLDVSPTDSIISHANAPPTHIARPCPCSCRIALDVSTSASHFRFHKPMDSR
jgi:hypothetical protein